MLIVVGHHVFTIQPRGNLNYPADLFFGSEDGSDMSVTLSVIEAIEK